jgi:hypothetical protein
MSLQTEQTNAERLQRLAGFAFTVRGVQRAIENARHAMRWGPDHTDVAFWLDQGELYAGVITQAEFDQRHPW